MEIKLGETISIKTGDEIKMYVVHEEHYQPSIIWLQPVDIMGEWLTVIKCKNITPIPVETKPYRLSLLDKKVIK